MFRRTSQLVCLLIFIVGCGEPSANSKRSLRLATTTSTRDSGLLDKLLPTFETNHDIRIDVIAVGTGKALKLGEAGDVDVVFVHARAAEDEFMQAGHGIRREDVMYNTFELLGPPNDPAAIKDLPVVEALQKIAQGNFRFASRGDDSGTHKRELALLQNAGGLQPWSEFFDTGQGMGATLVIANQRQAYVLADRGTYLRFQEKIDLIPLAAQSKELRNPYGIIVVNPEKHPKINSEMANQLVNYFIDTDTQQKIANFQVEEEPLFVPLHISTP